MSSKPTTTGEIGQTPSTSPTSESVAVFHHRFKNYGGGERVADALASALDADLHTLYVGESCEDETDAEPINQSKYMDGISGRINRRLVVENLNRSVDIEHLDLEQYDTVITSGDYAHFYTPTDEQRHIHYLHTPNRDLYNPPEFRALAGGRLRFFKTLYFQWLRGRDRNHASHVDKWVCNSEFIAERAKRHYDVSTEDLEVVNPPVDWSGLGTALDADERGDYWLTLGRLVPAKRLDVLVEAFDGLDEQLRIAGDGRMRDELESESSENVAFEGYVSESRKRDLLRNARGFLFMGERECFGMSVAEALAAGTPVIGCESGNIPNFITEPEGATRTTPANGIIQEAAAENARQGVKTAAEIDWDHQSIREDARQYSRERFEREVARLVS